MKKTIIIALIIFIAVSAAAYVLKLTRPDSKNIKETPFDGWVSVDVELLLASTVDWISFESEYDPPSYTKTTFQYPEEWEWDGKNALIGNTSIGREKIAEFSPITQLKEGQTCFDGGVDDLGVLKFVSDENTKIKDLPGVIRTYDAGEYLIRSYCRTGPTKGILISFMDRPGDNIGDEVFRKIAEGMSFKFK